MELRHLKYFVAVAEELHFGRAAARVGIAQPPLSQQIKTLEEEAGVTLLFRTKRRVELTAAGAAFLIEARAALAHAGQAVVVAQRAASGQSGHISVGFVSSAVCGKMSSIFITMRKRFPDVSLELHDMTSEEQVEAMKEGKLDVGLVRPPVASAQTLSMEIVWREPLVAVLPKGHRLAREKEVAIQNLAEEPFLIVPRRMGPGFFDQIMGLCLRAGFAARVVQEARTVQTIVSLVASGMGISLVPESLQNLRRTGVVYRRLALPGATTDLAVMWRNENTPPVVAAFLNIVRSAH
jgi:DNA-binding transcriptional LysR family regulator